MFGQISVALKKLSGIKCQKCRPLFSKLLWKVAPAGMLIKIDKVKLD